VEICESGSKPSSKGKIGERLPSKYYKGVFKKDRPRKCRHPWGNHRG